ncbi:MAG: EAL domain-containing protein [Acidobacteria bacterium]|nr:EAL domain-containing protein [Acidobacteriota bacterium]
MKIILADDDPVSRRLVQRVLETAGYNVHCTKDGRHALELLRSEQGPSLAILDWNMPEIDGPGVCRTIKTESGHPNVYVILLTSRESMQDLVKGFSSGADDYLIKPTHPEELKARVRAGERILLLQHTLMHEARHDPLTKLANRKHFIEQLERTSRRSRQQDGRFAVLFVDIDRFKAINDSIGHLAGDELICGLAERLTSCIRSASGSQEGGGRAGNDMVARVGGDEFVILLDPVSSVGDATRVAERIHEALKQPFKIAGESLVITASIGISVNTDDSKEPKDLLLDADTAMYKAKAAGHGRYRVCDSRMHHAAVDRLTFESDLRRAVEMKQFQVFYQPIVSLVDEHLEGFEALVRWDRPGFGIVTPDKFIPMAEDTGLIVPLGEWVLREACRQTQQWNESFNTRLKIAVNVSAKQFAKAGFLNMVLQALDDSGLMNDRLALELTESLTMVNADRIMPVLNALRANNVRLSCDDFGTGFSSLSYLHRLPLNTLKIDRSFVSQSTTLPEAKGIVEAIVTLGHKLRMDVVAEGVEDDTQVAWLKSLGCESAQGYFFAKPTSAEQMQKALEEKKFILSGEPKKELHQLELQTSWIQ